MSNQKILVLGGKGKTGRKVAQKLIEMGHNVRIGSRSAIPAFDWENPTTWAPALEDMDAVYITYQPDLAVPKALKSIKDFTQTALRKGVHKMVLLSGRGEKEAQLCEQVVMDTAPSWTIVRADWFNQNFSESFFLEPILQGHVALPQAATGIPFIDTDDIAAVVVKALTEKEHQGKVYEITGPRLLTLPQVTQEIAQATGRTICFRAISVEQYIAALRKAQIPEDYLWLIEYLFTNVLDGRNSSTTDVLEKVLGRLAKDFSEYAEDTAKTGVWNVPKLQTY